MTYRPYPNAGRALRHLERHAHHAPAAAVTATPEISRVLQSVAEALRSLPAVTFPALRLLRSEGQQVVVHPRMAGRTAAVRQVAAEALTRGEHVHSMSVSDGERCHGGEPDCPTLGQPQLTADLPELI